MPFVSKRRKAAFAQWKSRLTNRCTASHPPVLLPMATESGPELRHSLELSVEDELESIAEIAIKQEPLVEGQDEQMLLQDEVKVEVELFEPEDTYLSVKEIDPIGQDPNQKLFQKEEENQREIRCQFCLKQFLEVSGQNIITQSKIEFVLGLRKSRTPGIRPACCEGCRKMFELFYDFKRSCLEALTRPAELLIWSGETKSEEMLIDLKPKIRKKAKIKNTKRGRPAGSKAKKFQQTKGFDGLEASSKQKKIKLKQDTEKPAGSKSKDVQQTEEFEGLDEVSKQNSLEEQTPSTEAVPIKPSFECEICMEQFSDGLVLKKHWLNHFPTASNNTVTTDLPAPEPAPSIAVTEDEQKKTYCSRCRKWFSTKTIYIHHKPFCIKFNVRRKPEQSFPCSLCSRKFRREQDLTFHINKHNGLRTVACRKEGCTMMFFNPKARLTHEKFCGKDTQLICNVCGALFRSEGGLRIHLDGHGDPKYSCDICNKPFSRKANLVKHAATHSEERKFPCKVCGKRFKSAEANRVHQRIHTQEKPYVCHICGQRFMYNCLLKTHLEKGHEPV